MFVTTKELLTRAQSEKYAIGAFNVENMEMIKAVSEAASEMNAPVILQTTPSTVSYGGLACYQAMVKALVQDIDIPVALHLDHGSSFALAMQAMRCGYTSIMIDASSQPLETNIAVTRSVVEPCHANGITVEAELGKVGGKEDTTKAEKNLLTDPQEALTFVQETEVDALAVAIGSVHGVYQGKPNIDIQRLQEIQKLVSIPLVLHGTSGLSDEIVQECIKHGVCKVNYATDLRIAFTKGVSSMLQKHPETFDPKKYGMSGQDLVKQYVKDKMRILGCQNKARLHVR